MKISKQNKALFFILAGTLVLITYFQNCGMGGAGAISNAPVGTFSSTARYAITRVFQDGQLGYAGTRDTTLVKDSAMPNGITTSAGTNEKLFVRVDNGSFGLMALLKFALDGVADQYLRAGEDCDATIEVENAEISYFGVPSMKNSINYVFTFSAAAPVWDESTATWAESATGVAWPAGSPITPVLASANLDDYDAVEGVVNSSVGRWVRFNVSTSVAKRWLCHSDQNQGVVLQNTNGSLDASQATFMHSREFPTAALRPKLSLVISRVGPF